MQYKTITRLGRITLTLFLFLLTWGTHAQVGASVNILVNPTGIAQNSVTETAEQQGNSNTLYTAGNSCDAIARIESTLDLGIVTINVTVDTVPGTYNGQPFVGRYYAIHPSQNAQSEATLVLYFSQEDFDAYNQSDAVLSGDIPPIATDGSNLLITAFHGLPGDGNTGPNGAYDGNNKTVYTPTVTINSSGFFEAAFTIVGFSGFFAHTNNTGLPLPIVLSRLSAYNSGSSNMITWATATEAEGDYFEVERSADALDFHFIGRVAAIGQPNSNYTFNDEHPVEGNNYYRLKLMNQKGSVHYSSVVSAMLRMSDELLLTAYPNPMGNVLYIRIEGKVEQGAELTVKDVNGRTWFRQTVTRSSLLELNTKDLAGGAYYIRYSSPSGERSVSIVKH